MNGIKKRKEALIKKQVTGSAGVITLVNYTELDDSFTFYDGQGTEGKLLGTVFATGNPTHFSLISETGFIYIVYNYTGSTDVSYINRVNISGGSSGMAPVLMTVTNIGQDFSFTIEINQD